MSTSDNEVKANEGPETMEETQNTGIMDVKIVLPDKTEVVIPSVFVAEGVASLKQMLLDFVECAAFTCYSLHLRQLVSSDGTKVDVDVACSDYTELGSVVDPSTAVCIFELIPGEYNVKRVQDQLKRTNELMQNPPSLRGSVSHPAAAATKKANTEPKPTEPTNELPKTEDIFKSIEFSNFYGEVLYRTGKVDVVAKSGKGQSSKPVNEAVKSIFASGWNPVPAQRKIRGDLLYIEVVTANEGTLYVTAVSSGFYVNKCNRSHFDPSPATNHCFSHELFDTLLQASPTLKAAWASATAPRSAQLEETASPLDVMAWMYSQGRGNLAAEGVMPKPQWNAYNLEAYKNFTDGSEASARPSENAHHSYNLFRTQQELSSLQGVEELGAPREWNDEIQSIRALKATDANEKVMKAKLEYKVLSEFAAACRTTAVAISEGLIAPLSMGEGAQSDIYVYNGIFFSKAEDSKDSFKICNGDEAYRKCTGREIQNQRLLRSLEVEGAGLILSTIVDYKGQRIIGQSIIPGIFAQGENVARLMYGVLDKEKMLTVKNSSLKIMQGIASKLNMPVRNAKLFPFGEPTPVSEEEKAAAPAGSMLEEIQASPIKVDEEDNVADARSPSTPHCGPIEGKVLRGSDGRDYILEMMRLAPRDANYVSGEKGTGKIADLEKTDKDLAMTYILRKELIDIYVQNQLNTRRQKVMKEATDKQKEMLAEIKAKTPKPAAAVTATAEGEKKEEEATPEPTLDEESARKLAEEYGAKMKEITIESLGLSINPNCFLDYEFDVDAATREKDEATARELAVFLWETVLPAITKQVRDGELQVRDNASLVKVLHRHGVNMRYLGTLLKKAVEEEKEDEDLLQQGKQKVHAMPLYWREMLVVELVARAAKYVLNDYYKNDSVYAAPAQTIASLLNHVVSMVVPAATAAAVTAAPVTATTDSKKSKKGGKKGGKQETPVPAPVATKSDNKVSFLPVPDSASSREECLRVLQETAVSRFCINLNITKSSESTEADVDATKKFFQSRLNAMALVRRICQCSGIQIATRKYNFSGENPFVAADILGVTPIIKSCEPETLLQEFEEMMESSRVYQQEGNYPYAYEMAQQALGTITQITGPYHVHTSRAVDQMTNVLIAAGDFSAAEQFAQKSLAISIQLNGFDSQESAMHHLKLGILQGELGNRAASAQHLLTTKYLVQLMAGDNHTEMATIYTRFAAMYEEVGDFEAVWQCYVKAKFHTNDLMQICALNIALAASCSRNGHVFEALELQKQAYTMLKELVGDKESQLSEVKETLETYLRAVNEEKIKLASDSLVNERLKELLAKTSLQPATEKAASSAEQLSEQELFAAFAEIDKRAEKAKKAAKKNAKKSTADKAKK